MSAESPAGWKLTIEADDVAGPRKVIVVAIDDKYEAYQALFDAEPLRQGRFDPLTEEEVAALGLRPGEVALVPLTTEGPLDRSSGVYAGKDFDPPFRLLTFRPNASGSRDRRS